MITYVKEILNLPKEMSGLKSAELTGLSGKAHHFYLILYHQVLLKT